MEDIFLELCSGAGIYETFFHNVIGKIRGRQAGSLEEIWDAAWEKFGPRVYLLPEQQQLIRQTGQGLGHMDLDSQLMALRLLQKRLEQQILVEERELGERQKIIRVLSAHQLEPKRMQLVYPYVDREPNMVLIEAVRGGRPRMTVEKPLIVYEKPGVYTREITDIYGY